MPDIFDSQSNQGPANSAQTGSPSIFNVPNNSSQNTHFNTTTFPTEADGSPDLPVPGLVRDVNQYSQIMSQEQPSTNPLQAFAAKPVNTFFDSQESGEQVLLLLRQHPVTQVKWIIVAVVLVFVPFLFSAVPLLDFLPQRYHIVALVGWYLMVVGFSLEAFLDWFFNVYIITDERIIDVDFSSLLFKNVSYAKVDRIEDVSFTTSGTLGAIFDFGTVVIQTAAAIQEFAFDHVPHPSKVTAFINELINEEELEKIEGRVT